MQIRRAELRWHEYGLLYVTHRGAIWPALGGLAVMHWSVASVYAGFGMSTAFCALGLVLVPRLKEFLSLEHEHIKDWYEQQYPAIFHAPKNHHE